MLRVASARQLPSQFSQARNGRSVYSKDLCVLEPEQARAGSLPGRIPSARATTSRHRDAACLIQHSDPSASVRWG